MKTVKKALALLLVMAMVVSMFSGITAHAEGSLPMTLTAEREGDNVVLKLTLTEEMNFGGMGGSISFDSEAFTLSSITSDVFSVMPNINAGAFSMDTSADLTLPAGALLATFTFAVGEAYAAGEEYSFSIELDELYDFKLTDYDCSLTTETTFQEEAEEPAEPELTLSAERDGDYVLLKLMTVGDLNLGGMNIRCGWNTDVFSCADDDVTSDILDVAYGNRILLLDTSSNLTVPDGTVICTMKLAIGEAYVQGEEYSFTMTFDELYDFKTHDYAFTGETITAILQEEAEEPEFEVELTARREGDNLLVELKALTDFNLGGMRITYNYDDAAFAYKSLTANKGLGVVGNPTAKKVTFDSGDKIEFSAGEVVATLTLTFEEGFQYDTTYTFTMYFDEAYNYSFVDLLCNEETVSATYMEEGKYTVTWVNYDGTELEVDENVTSGTMPSYDGAEPTRSDDAACAYTFAGWDPEPAPVTKDVTYTATFEAKDHDWGEPTYVWADDNSTVTATRVCKNNEAHVETETVNTTSVVTADPTCEGAGETTYTASFTNEAFTTQTKKVAAPPALGHDWAFVDFTWTETADGWTAVANYKCRNDETHTQTVNATVTSETTAATCEADGKTVYTATVAASAALDGEARSDTKEVTIPALGHDWAFVDFTWTETADGWTAVANYKCGNDETHIQTVNAAVTSETTAATCEAAGKTVYTATVDAKEAPDGEARSDTKEVTIPAIGHDWAFVDFTWTETADGWTAVANYVCKNDETHTQTVEATVTSVITDATCEADGKTVYTATVAEDVSLDKTAHEESKEVKIAALGHDWAAPTYEWAEDNSTVTAKRVCKNNEAHVETETVNTTSEITKPATCEEAGETTYTATFENAAFETQTKVVNKPEALNHDWEFTGFTWTGDDENGYTAAVANYVCKNDETHTRTVEAKLSVDTTDATCTEPGEVVYTASVDADKSLDGKEHTESKTVAAVALGHKWAFVDFTWTETADGFTAVANYKCENDETHTQSVNATVTSETTDATCEADGKTVYTATVAAADSPDKAEHSDTKEVTIPALGHKWAFVDFTWTETADGFTAVANYKCENDETHTQTVNATVTSETTDATCTENGKTVFTATVTADKSLDGTAHTDTKEEMIPATGHDWEFVDFTWTETADGFTAVANYKCKNDETHTQTVNATVTSETTDATCEADGKTVYTATVATADSPDKAEHSDTKEVTIPALGHKWAFVDFTWKETADGFTAVANYKCENDETHTQTVNATVTSETTDATCTENGKTVFTATVTADKSLDGTAHTDTKEEMIPATGHDWEFVDFTWTETADGFTAVANYKCKNDETHIVTAEAMVWVVEEEDPTCEEPGAIYYLAEIEGIDSPDGQYHDENKTVAIPATGHDWEFVDFTWTGDDENGYTAAVANYKCKNDETHTQTVNAMLSAETTDATCEADGKTVYTATVAAADSLDKADHSDTKEVIIPATGHDWDTPTYTWADDNSEVTAEAVCKNDATHKVTETVETTSEITHLPTCEEPGATTYTAEFDTPIFEVQTKTVEGPAAFGHDWEFVDFTWTGDDENGYTAAAANYKCKNDNRHKQTVAATLSTETTDATCEADGKTVYTATVAAADSLDKAEHSDTKEVTIPALGHDWSFAGFKWYQNSDGTLNENVVANFKCKRDASHTTTLTVVATVATTDPTCEEQGKIVYTVVLDSNTSLDGNEYTDTKTVVIPAIGHKWAFVDFTWTETADGFTAVANYKCENDETHTQTVNATVTSETTDATCEADGKTVYTATVAAADSLDKAEHSDTKEVIIKATGHDWGEPEYTWVGNDEDGYEVTAVVVCKNDETHTITETVTATYEVVTAPTTEAEGLGRYTATFTKEPFTTQTRDVTLAMIGYHIIVDDYTKGGATTSLVADKLYDGEVDFTVSAELACSVGILNEDGTITRVNCTDVDGEHHFKVTVDGADLHLVLVYKGDADLNAELELKDSTRIKRTLVELMTMTELEKFAADADADGQMLGKDATLIARYMVDLDEIIWGVATRGRVA